MELQRTSIASAVFLAVAVTYLSNAPTDYSNMPTESCGNPLPIEKLDAQKPDDEQTPLRRCGIDIRCMVA